MFVASVKVCVGVLLPVNGGLHCGFVAKILSPAMVSTLPPVNGGLHCGHGWNM
jgi:hypothetical protein